jgi:hypothetical protein
MNDYGNWYNNKYGTAAINAFHWQWGPFSYWKTVYTDKVSRAVLFAPTAKWSMQISLRTYY